MPPSDDVANRKPGRTDDQISISPPMASIGKSFGHSTWELAVEAAVLEKLRKTPPKTTPSNGHTIYWRPQTHEPNGTSYFAPPIKRLAVTAERRDGCVVYTFPASRIVRNGEPP